MSAHKHENATTSSSSRTTNGSSSGGTIVAMTIPLLLRSSSIVVLLSSLMERCARACVLRACVVAVAWYIIRGYVEGDGGVMYSGATLTAGYGMQYRENFVHHSMEIPGLHGRGGIYFVRTHTHKAHTRHTTPYNIDRHQLQR